METKRLFVKFDSKAVDDAGVIEGYGSIFGNVDQGGDIVAPGAFAKSLAAHKSAGTLPAMLWQHDSTSPIGVWEEMAEDSNGLKVKGRLEIGSEIGRRNFNLIKMGALRGLSIGYRTVVDQYDRDTDIRTLKELELWEVSPVTFPMNRSAGISVVKSATLWNTITEFESWLRDAAGISRREAKALASHGFKALARDATEESAADDALVRELRALANNLNT
jgi:HK97 family phage prohead protease